LCALVTVAKDNDWPVLIRRNRNSIGQNNVGTIVDLDHCVFCIDEYFAKRSTTQGIGRQQCHAKLRA
jgi:hypothetical protein